MSVKHNVQLPWPTGNASHDEKAAYNTLLGCGINRPVKMIIKASMHPPLGATIPPLSSMPIHSVGLLSGLKQKFGEAVIVKWDAEYSAPTHQGHITVTIEVEGPRNA